MELNLSQKHPIDYTLNKKTLAVRPMPLRLGLRIQQSMGGDDSVEVDVSLVSECISECVIYADTGERVWKTAAEVDDLDSRLMMRLFNDLSKLTFSEEPEKN